MATKLKKAHDALIEQIQWMEKCGGTLAGYIAHYGSKDDPEHSGDGGEAIWAADFDEFLKLRTAYDTLARKAH